MQTQIHPALQGKPGLAEAEAILRSCVHCGFCHAACPTYQLLGDELDSPRGRIYLIKNLLETGGIGASGRQHLDRCLTCRACETACPSGVRYGSLLDIGRVLVEGAAPRGMASRLLRGLIRLVVPRRYLFVPLLRLGQALRPLLPPRLKQRIPRPDTLPPHRAWHLAGPPATRKGAAPPAPGAQPGQAAKTSASSDTHRLDKCPQAPAASKPEAQPEALLLGGCVQTPATPNVNRALQRLLAQLGIPAKLIDIACCGSLDYHLAAPEAAKVQMRKVMAAVAPYPGLPIISTATGCGLTLKAYGEIFQTEPEADEAAAFSRRLVDAAEFLAGRSLRCAPGKVALHLPCTMQHGLNLSSQLQALLAKAGCELLPVQGPRRCCGSAGAYSRLQPQLAAQLRQQTLAALTAPAPDYILTANIGCHLHLAAASPVPVLHWLELLAPLPP